MVDSIGLFKFRVYKKFLMEPELNLMAPEGVSIHTARLVSCGPSSGESYAAMSAAAWV